MGPYEGTRTTDTTAVRQVLYKRQQIGCHPHDLSGAIADHLEGPYTKHPLTPVTNSGHEVWVWPHGPRVAGMVD